MIVIELDWEYSTNIRVAANELTIIRQRHIFVQYTNYTKGRIIMIVFFFTTETIVFGMYRDITAKSWNISSQYKNKTTSTFVHNMRTYTLKNI